MARKTGGVPSWNASDFPTGTIRPTSAYGTSVLFTGREWDSETGLYYDRARYYSPKLGRFISRDPLGQLPGPNLYTYVGNNPVNWVDPFGLLRENRNALELFYEYLLHPGDVFFVGGTSITTGFVLIGAGGATIVSTWAIPGANIVTIPAGIANIAAGAGLVGFGGWVIIDYVAGY